MTEKIKNNQTGFTLIELLIYVAIVTILIGGIVTFAWDMLYGQVKSTVQQEVYHNLSLVDNRLHYELKNATEINSIGANEVCLSTSDSGNDPTRIYIDSGQLMISWGGGGTSCASPSQTAPLTSQSVTVSEFSINDLSPAQDLTNIQYQLTIAHKNPLNRAEWDYTQSLTTSVEIRNQ